MRALQRLHEPTLARFIASQRMGCGANRSTISETGFDLRESAPVRVGVLGGYMMFV